MDPRTGLDGRKISSPPGFDPRRSSPYSVAIPTELPDPHKTNLLVFNILDTGCLDVVGWSKTRHSVLYRSQYTVICAVQLTDNWTLRPGAATSSMSKLTRKDLNILTLIDDFAFPFYKKQYQSI